ncbi:MAG: TQO small subunit DoxD [Acidobacteriaceae bacterium]
MISLFDTHTQRWDTGLYRVCIFLGRIVLAYFFFTQLWWKLPPNFGCTNNFAFPKPTQQNNYDVNGSSGLCYWMGLESVYASHPRKILVADMHYAGLPTISVDIGPVAKLNGILLDKIFIPNIRVIGWAVWSFEFSAFFFLLLGLFSRLGSLAALGILLQLYIGLANIPSPFEWEWTYGILVAMAIVMLAAASGRTLGLDALLRPKLAEFAKRGNFLAKLGLWLS